MPPRRPLRWVRRPLPPVAEQARWPRAVRSAAPLQAPLPSARVPAGHLHRASDDRPGTQPPAAGGPSSPRPAPPGGGPAQGGNPAGGLGGVTNGLGNTTQGVTDKLGQTVGGVNPELGKPVTDTGKALSDLVRGLGSK